MKKIFIPVLISLTLGAVAPCYSNDFLSPDSDGYWMNYFRERKKYPVNFYFQTRPEKPTTVETKTVVAREYPRNEAVAANVGQRMFDVTNYTVTTTIENGEKYTFDQNALIYNNNNNIPVRKGDVFSPIGEVKINGQYYMLIPLRHSEYVGIIDRDGKFYNSIGYIDGKQLVVPHEITIYHPAVVSISPLNGRKEDIGAAELEYEVLYDGMKGNEMYFLYQDGKDKEHAQRYTFPTSQKEITINGNLRFEILHVTPETVDYKIL